MCADEILHLVALKQAGRLRLPVAIVTPAPPAATAALLADLGLTVGAEHGVEAYCDESLSCYTEAGMRFVSTAALVKGKPVAGPMAVLRYLGWSLCCRCRWPGLAAGDWRQVGGVLVVGRRGRYFTLTQEYPGIPAIDDEALISACDAAARGEAPPPDGGIAAATAASAAGSISASAGGLRASAMGTGGGSGDTTSEAAHRDVAASAGGTRRRGGGN